MDPVAVSTGSACSAGAIEPSAVLLAMGLSREAAFESVRFSLGRFTTAEEIEIAAQKTICRSRLRAVYEQKERRNAIGRGGQADFRSA